ncbi:PilW family protein [Reinekea sp.]|jgi:type IV pilus assembly protein PilW|uniref:PilW family protein n=1 Tax=Reinekea sp. TaxID=1970455 RepID=UPI002A833338|nr:PilW family protein [Reinekea sp.]
MNRARQQGLSLIELMVAVGLSSFIIAGIIQVVLSNQKAFYLTESMVRVQGSGRFTLNFIADDVRQSGSYGCIPTLDAASQNIQSFTANLTDINAIQTTVTGTFENSNDGADGGTEAFDQPDQLALLKLSRNSATLGAGILPPTTLAMSDEGDFEQDDYVLVSNCEVADLIQLGSGTTNTQMVSASNQLRYNFYARQDKRSTINEIEHRVFSVNSDNELTLAINGEPAQVLLGGVENIQYKYGVDSDSDLVPDYFDDINEIPANRVGDIIAVTISVLTVSSRLIEGDVEAVTSSPQTISFNEKTLTMTDNRLHKVFETTVMLRNRMN